MFKNRASGVLMHITSLPSKYGIGVMGENAKYFIDKIKSMGFSVWQVLPLNPPNLFGSPYASNSAFAISHMLIDPEGLFKIGLISKEELENSVYPNSPYTTDYDFAYNKSLSLLRLAFKNINSDLKEKIENFCLTNEWVNAYSLYEALKEKNGGTPWFEWEEKYARYELLEKNDGELISLQNFYKFVQFIAFSQWQEIKNYANEKGVKILGDMPVYVSFDSCDVWSNRSLFEIDDKTFERKRVAGVPPDYFSADGQLWGNPLYDWNEMERTDFSWWCDRILASQKIFDMVRIDHFRAFASYWAVDSKSETAKTGEWLDGPKMKLFDAIGEKIKDYPIIAEDLGTFGEDVIELLENTKFPGMRVIQFGFDPMGDSTHLPHNYPQNSIAYVGTHDNATLLAWLWEATPAERRFALDYCGFEGENWGDGGFKSKSCRKIIETVWRSSAKIAIISFQDLCGFGGDARMNVPSRASGNWQFRTTNDTIEQIDSQYYKKINSLFRR
ncbi:MAG: 4-alpha-glucanotransferase [Oscillospiraceae bacterium]